MCQEIRIIDPEPQLQGRLEMAETLRQDQGCFKKEGQLAEEP